MRILIKIPKLLALVLTITVGTLYAKSQNVIENLEIAATDAVKVADGTTIKNLTVRADKSSCGQLIVEKGVVNVERLTYKFSIIPAELTMIALPMDIPDLNSAEATNFSALGLTQNTGTKRYLIKTFNAEARANNLEPWVQTTTPDMQAYKAYLIYVIGVGSDPVDLEFYFNNLKMDKKRNPNTALIDVSLVGKAIQQTYPVKIKAANANSNTLEVAVYNDNESVPAPLNYQDAVNNANLYFTEDDTAFRISLPNSEPCKVLIMDKSMKKVLRAIEYVSPAEISVQGLKRGKYTVYMEYGGASNVKTLEIKSIKK